MNKQKYTDSLGGMCESIENTIESTGNLIEQNYERSKLISEHRESLENFKHAMETIHAAENGFSGTYDCVAAEIQRF